MCARTGAKAPGTAGGPLWRPPRRWRPRRRRRAPLLEQVQRLPQPYRQVIFLRYYEGYSVKEIALLLGKSPALVSTHLKRARERLKTMLGGMFNAL